MKTLPVTDRLNIQTTQDLIDSGLKPGDRIHVSICGNHVSEDAHYVGPTYSEAGDVEEIIVDREKERAEVRQRCTGVRIRIGKHETDLDWGDIIELWPVSLQKRLPAPFEALPEIAHD